MAPDGSHTGAGELSDPLNSPKMEKGKGLKTKAKDPKGKRDHKAPPRYRAPRGDIVLRTRAGNPLPLELFRLLPAWTVVRPVIATEE